MPLYYLSTKYKSNVIAMQYYHIQFSIPCINTEILANKTEMDSFKVFLVLAFVAAANCYVLTDDKVVNAATFTFNVRWYYLLKAFIDKYW